MASKLANSCTILLVVDPFKSESNGRLREIKTRLKAVIVGPSQSLAEALPF